MIFEILPLKFANYLYVTFWNHSDEMWPFGITAMRFDLLESQQWDVTFWNHSDEMWPIGITAMKCDLLESQQWDVTFWNHSNEMWPFGITAMRWDLLESQRWDVTFWNNSDEMWPFGITAMRWILFMEWKLILMLSWFPYIISLAIHHISNSSLPMYKSQKSTEK